MFIVPAMDQENNVLIGELCERFQDSLEVMCLHFNLPFSAADGLAEIGKLGKLKKLRLALGFCLDSAAARAIASGCKNLEEFHVRYYITVSCRAVVRCGLRLR